LAVLQGISSHLYEAADCGATPGIIRIITLPLLTPRYFFFIVIISIIGSFQIF